MKPETKLLLRWGGFIVFLLILIVMSWNVVSSNAAHYRTTPEFRNMELASITIPYGENNEAMQLVVRVADEDDERSTGFANIGAGVIEQSVILVVFNRDVSVEFSAEQVESALDLMFLDADGNVLKIYRAESHSAEVYPPPNESFSFRFVLEAPAGFFDPIAASSTRVVVDLAKFHQQQLNPETQ